jgi:hypothetical protein
MKIERFFPERYRRPVRRTHRMLQDVWFHLENGAPWRLVIVVGSSYRVGSTWLFLLLRKVAHCRSGVTRAPGELNRFGALVLCPEAYDYLHRLQGYAIFKTHSLPPGSAALAGNAKFVSVYRDPRDVLVSASFFFAYLGEEKGGWPESFRQLSAQERIQLLIKGRSELPILPTLEAWFRTPFAYKTRFEDLKRQPAEELGKILGYIGISTTGVSIEEAILRHSFEAGSGRRPGEAREDHPLRKGVVGDWRNYFDRACIDAFRTEQNGHWNQLLLDMGYESSPDWT